MRALLALMFLAYPALAANRGAQYGAPLNGAGQAITPATVTASTLTVTSFPAGEVLISTTAGLVSHDGSNFTYNSVTHALGVTYGVTAGSVTVNGAGAFITSNSSITTTGGLFGNSLAVGGSSITTAGALTLTPSQAVTVSGANGNIISASSITTTGGMFANRLGLGTSNPATLLHMSSGTLTIDGTGGALTFGKGTGITAGTSVTTMTSPGVLFFIDSTTVSGSTCTGGGGTVVNFSTFTLPANVIVSTGMAVREDCWYINSAAAPTSPQETVRFFGLNGNQATFTSASVNTASQIIHVWAIVSMWRIGMAEVEGYAWANTLSGNNTYPVATDGGGNLPTRGLDWTATHVLNCAAQDSGGGPVNFLAMKVSIQ